MIQSIKSDCFGTKSYSLIEGVPRYGPAWWVWVWNGYFGWWFRGEYDIIMVASQDIEAKTDVQEKYKENDTCSTKTRSREDIKEFNGRWQPSQRQPDRENRVSESMGCSSISTGPLITYEFHLEIT